MARENAFMILNQYFEDESFLNIALNEQLKKSNLKNSHLQNIDLKSIF